MPRANGARVARNLGRLVPILRTGEEVSLGSHAAYAVGAAGSIILWCTSANPSQNVGDQRVFTFWSGGVPNVDEISAAYNATLAGLRVYQARASVFSQPVGVTNMVHSNEIHCLVVTWDASGYAAFVDGVLCGTSTTVPPTFSGTVTLKLGQNAVVNYQPLVGSVGGEVYLYNRKLTKGEVEAHYFDGEVPSAPVSAWGPSGWPATGTTVTLTGGSGNNGTIVGSVVLMNEPAEQKPARAVRQRAGSRFQQNLASASMGGWVVADHATLKPAVFSIECRIRCDARTGGSLGAGGIGASNYRAIVIKTTSSAWADGWGLIEAANAPAGQFNLRLFIENYGSGTSFLVTPQGKEIHVLATYDGATAKMYVDGELVNSFVRVGGVQVAQPIRIGHAFAGGASNGYIAEGSIRDVRYYSRVLSAVEARARFQDNAEPSGLIAAWDLSESRRQSVYSNLAGVVAKDRVGGFDAVWTGGMVDGDADDIAVRRAPRRKNIERVNIPWLSGSARTALDASLVVGTGSFSVAGTFLIHSWNANTNNLITASDDAAYASGWVLVYTPITDATATLVGYVGSAGPNAYGTTSGRVTIQRGKRFRLAFVADAATQKCSWYIDGVRLSEVTVAAWNLPNTPRFCVGLSVAIASATGMRAADVRYAVGRAWTKEEVEADANGVDDALSGVTHAWPMDDQADGATSLRATKGSSPLSTLGGGAAVKADALAYDGWVQDKLTNRLPSQNFLDTTVWVNKGAATSRAANGVDLWGDAAYTFTGSNVSSAFTVQQQVPAPQLGRRMRFEMDLKYDNNAWIALTGNTGGTSAYFNIQTGVVGTAGNALAKEITPLGGGWYRCAIEYLESDADAGGTSTGGSVRLYFAFADGTVTGNGNGKNITVGRQSVFMAENTKGFTIDTFVSRPNLYNYVSVEDALVVSGNGWQLIDKSRGNRNWAQGTPTKRAAYNTGGLDGKPYLLFDGIDDHYVVSTPFTTDLSVSTARANWLIAAVVHPTTAGGSSTIFDSFDSSSADRVLVTQSGFSVAGQVSWYDGAWNQVGASTTGAQLLVYDLREGKGGVYRNGVQIGSFGSYRKRLVDDTTVTLGIAVDYLTGMFTGRLYDLAIFKNQTDGDFAAVHRYFANRFPSLGIARM